MNRFRLIAIPLLLLLGLVGSGCRDRQSDDFSAPAASGAIGAADAASPHPEHSESGVIYLEITPAAATQVTATARQSGLTQWWLRCELVPGGCTGFQNKLWIDTDPPGPQDFVYRVGNILCVLLKCQQKLVQGTRIDWGTKDGKTGFIVTAPHSTAETKTAVTKWIQDEFHQRNPGLATPTEPPGDSEEP